MRSLLGYAARLAACALVTVVVAAALAGAGPAARALLADDDGDGVVNNTEVVGGSDPDNPQSVPEELLFGYLADSDACDDGLDNDLDGTVDSADSGCSDNDRDLFSNPLEIQLGSDPENGGSYPEHTLLDAVLASLGYAYYQTCANEIDDDRDGAIDADDPGCDPILSDADPFDDRVEKLFGSDPEDASSVPEHELVNPGSCSDGVDNDHDGNVDGADSACSPVTNDDLANARVIAAVPFADQLKLSAATAELGEPRSECSETSALPATVWYQYAAPSSMALAADTTGSNFVNSIAVWTRSGDRFKEVACGGYASAARVSFNAHSGETYYIQISGFPTEDTPADLRFTLDIAHPPSNDDFASATMIGSIPFEDALTVADATTEAGEPDGDCFGAEPYDTVWYQYVAGGNQQVIASTAGSEYGSLLSVWTHTPFGLSEIACAGTQRRVAFETESGQTYYIQVFSSSPGTATELTFTLEPSTPPPNDDFANATGVSSLPFKEDVDVFTATREPKEPEGTCSPFDDGDGGTVWYRVVAQQDGYVSASVTASDGDFVRVVLGAYQGTALSTLTEIGCVGSFGEGGSALAISVQAGETYYFQVESFFGDPGVLAVRFELLVVPSCAPAQLTVRDAHNDAFVFGPEEDVIDATSVSGGHDGSHYCVRVQFARSLPTRRGEFGQEPSASIGFDTDSNAATGFNGVAFPCSGSFGGRPVLGSEVSARIPFTGQVVVPLRVLAPRPPAVAGDIGPQPAVFGFALFGERSLEFIVPMSVLGDDEFYFAMSFNGLASSDCLPSGGGIRSPTPAANGDINCDGAVNSLDGSLVLQKVAGIRLETLLCEYLGNVDQRDGTGPIDAVLILQYSAGLLPQLPGQP